MLDAVQLGIFNTMSKNRKICRDEFHFSLVHRNLNFSPRVIILLINQCLKITARNNHQPNIFSLTESDYKCFNQELHVRAERTDISLRKLITIDSMC